MARKRKEITITNEEKQKLQGIAKSRTAPRNAVERAKIILFVLDGKTNDEIAEKVQLSKSAINNTIKKWRIFGVNAALEDLARPGKPKVITNEARMWVIHLGCQMPQNVPNGPPL
ncbi:MAG: helix-turn-helix domain-containing protein, partial [Lachnospiraceae bacterium]|nr:helix-turn-helix domain-containing protein [Lachnospiraceae bacterium]